MDRTAEVEELECPAGLKIVFNRGNIKEPVRKVVSCCGLEIMVGVVPISYFTAWGETNAVEHEITIVNPQYSFPTDLHATVRGRYSVAPSYSTTEPIRFFSCSTSTAQILSFKEVRLEQDQVDAQQLDFYILLEDVYGLNLSARGQLFVRSTHTDFTFMAKDVPLFVSKCKLASLSQYFYEKLEKDPKTVYLHTDDFPFEVVRQFLGVVFNIQDVEDEARQAVIEMAVFYRVPSIIPKLEKMEAEWTTNARLSFQLADKLNLPNLRRLVVSEKLKSVKQIHKFIVDGGSRNLSKETIVAITLANVKNFNVSVEPPLEEVLEELDQQNCFEILVRLVFHHMKYGRSLKGQRIEMKIVKASSLCGWVDRDREQNKQLPPELTDLIHFAVKLSLVTLIPDKSARNSQLSLGLFLCRAIRILWQGATQNGAALPTKRLHFYKDEYDFVSETFSILYDFLDRCTDSSVGGDHCVIPNAKEALGSSNETTDAESLDPKKISSIFNRLGHLFKMFYRSITITNPDLIFTFPSEQNHSVNDVQMENESNEPQTEPKQEQ